MTTYITSVNDLQQLLNKSITIAINNTAKRLLDKLHELIRSEYYNLYSPKEYSRTDQFYNSAVMEIVNNCCVKVGIDFSLMNYSANYRLKDGSIGHWTGEDQAYMADAGFHGNAYIYRDGHFWKSFKEFCDVNAPIILKEELAKQGVNVN